MSLNLCVLLEPVANTCIKTLSIEGSLSPVNCCHRVFCRVKLVSPVKKGSMEYTMISLTHEIWPLLDLYPILCPRSKHIRAFKYRIFIFTDTHTHTHIYIYICVCVCVCVAGVL